MMHVEFDYCIMHHCRFRVTNRVSLGPLQASPEIQVVTLNPARTFFACPVSPSRSFVGSTFEFRAQAQLYLYQHSPSCGTHKSAA
jgi:hypothetical protein